MSRNEFFALTRPVHKRVDLVVKAHQIGKTKISAEFASKSIENKAVGLCTRSDCLTEGTQASFPVDESTVLFKRRSDRQDHICTISYLTAANFKADKEVDSVEGIARSGRIVEIAQVNATDDEGLDAALSCSFQHLRSVESARCGDFAPRKALTRICAGHRTTKGQESGKKTGLEATAFTRTTRHPLDACLAALGKTNNFTEQPRGAAGALADQDHSPVKTRGEIGELATFTDLSSNLDLGTRSATEQLSRKLGEASGSHGGKGSHAELALASGLAHPQEERAALILGLKPNQEDLAGTLKLRVSNAQTAACHVGSKE